MNMVVDMCLRTATALAVLAGLAQSCMALELEVGRASVKTSGEGWSVLRLDDKGETYSGEVQGLIQSETKVLLHGPAQQLLQSLVVVRASAGGMPDGYMEYSPDCSSSAGWHAKGNSTPSQPFTECYKIGKNWPGEECLRVIAPKALDAMGDARQRLPRSWTPILAHYANSNGSFVDVTLFVTPELIDPKDTTVSNVPTGMDPKYVQLAESLMAAVRGSVRSMSGKLAIPEMRFSPSPPPDKRFAQAYAPFPSLVSDN